MNHYNCRLCGSKNFDNEINIGPFPKAAQYYPKKEEFSHDIPLMLEVCRCKDCKLVQLKNEPVDYYKTVITAATLSKALQDQREVFFHNIASKINKKNPKAIEIGCANGANLPLLEEAGFLATGIEFQSGDLMEYKSDKRIRNSFINDLSEEENSGYDLVVCFNFLEHQPEQRSFISKIYDLLSDDSYCLITVPNFTFLQEEKCSYEFVADHLVYYTLDSLVSAFSGFGFSVCEAKLINNDNDILLICQKKILPDLHEMKISLDSLVLKFNSLLQSISDQHKTVAVWGAGHRGLALLSLIDHTKISYIIDSADFKQGKYSPLSHLKIKSPEILSSPDSKLDVLIVMLPGIYPDEVIKYVENLNLGIQTIKFVHNNFVNS
jgi:hypothetical protein